MMPIDCKRFEIYLPSKDHTATGPGMNSNLFIVIDHLQACMGELAEKFVAKEMLHINKKYVSLENQPDGFHISWRQEIPHLIDDELFRLLQRIDECLGYMIGPQLSKKIIQNIEDDIAALMMASDPIQT